MVNIISFIKDNLVDEGVSTRRVEKIVTTLGVKETSASSVFRITKELDKKI